MSEQAAQQKPPTKRPVFKKVGVPVSLGALVSPQEAALSMKPEPAAKPATILEEAEVAEAEAVAGAEAAQVAVVRSLFGPRVPATTVAPKLKPKTAVVAPPPPPPLPLAPVPVPATATKYEWRDHPSVWEKDRDEEGHFYRHLPTGQITRSRPKSDAAPEEPPSAISAVVAPDAPPTAPTAAVGEEGYRWRDHPDIWEKGKDKKGDYYLHKPTGIKARRKPKSSEAPYGKDLETYYHLIQDEITQPLFKTEVPEAGFVPTTRRGFAKSILQTFRQYELPAPPKTPDYDACLKMGGKGAGKAQTYQYQEFVRDYMRWESPYRGILVYHGLGSGKTCTAIAAMEALYGTGNRKIVVMTPFSLRKNFIKEITFCGFRHFRLQNYWVPFKNSVKENPTIRLFAINVLKIPEQYLEKKAPKNIWIPDFTQEKSNYDSLTPTDRTEIRDQINNILVNDGRQLNDPRKKFFGLIHFINYNGISASELKEIACYRRETFDNAVIVIDEIHNLIRLMQGNIMNYMVKGPKSRREIDTFTPERKDLVRCRTGQTYHRGFLFYSLLTEAKQSKIIGLSGTPLINFPEELGILTNVLHGYIPLAEGTLTRKDKKPVGLAEVKQIENAGHHSLYTDFVEVKPAIGTARFLVSTLPEGIRKLPFREGEEEKGVERIPPQEDAVDFTRRVQHFVADCDKAGYTLSKEGTKSFSVPLLPPYEEDFRNDFLEQDGVTIKNKITLAKRLTGLISYYKGARKELMPEVIRDEIVRVSFSEYQQEKYTQVRNEEIEVELSAPSKGQQQQGDVFLQEAGDLKNMKKSNNYRMGSRQACNFTFPPGVVRPRPRNQEEVDEEAGDDPTDILDVRATDVRLEKEADDNQSVFDDDLRSRLLEAGLTEEQVVAVLGVVATEEEEAAVPERLKSLGLSEELVGRALALLEAEVEKKAEEMAEEEVEEEKAEEAAAAAAAAEGTAGAAAAEGTAAAAAAAKEAAAEEPAEALVADATAIASAISEEKDLRAKLAEKGFTEDEVNIVMRIFEKEMEEAKARRRMAKKGLSEDKIAIAIFLIQEEREEESEEESESEEEPAAPAPVPAPKPAVVYNAKRCSAYVLEGERYSQRIQRAKNCLREYAKAALRMDNPAGLRIYSPKFYEMISRITKIQGPALVYSQFLDMEGIGIFTICLEVNGWEPIQIEVNRFGQVSLPEKTILSLRKGPQSGTLRFIKFTGGEKDVGRRNAIDIFNANFSDVNKNIAAVFEEAGYKNNIDGYLCKLMCITSAGAEGLSLRNVRSVHIMEPYWNDVRMAQVKGRAVRICSHMDLPVQERNVQIFTYITVFSEEAQRTKAGKLRIDENIRNRDSIPADQARQFGIPVPAGLETYVITSDERLWVISQRKKTLIQNLEAIMKRAAVDCQLDFKENFAGERADGPNSCLVLEGKVGDFLYHPILKEDIALTRATIKEGPALPSVARAVPAAPTPAAAVAAPIRPPTARIKYKDGEAVILVPAAAAGAGATVGATNQYAIFKESDTDRGTQLGTMTAKPSGEPKFGVEKAKSKEGIIYLVPVINEDGRPLFYEMFKEENKDTWAEVFGRMEAAPDGKPNPREAKVGKAYRDFIASKQLKS